MSWLLVFACGFWCFHFVVNLVGGVVQVGPTGSIYFFGFFHSRTVWAKTGTSLGDEGFLKRFSPGNRHGRGKKNEAFSLLSRETL